MKPANGATNMTQQQTVSIPYRAALVTGAAARIGRAVALDLAALGLAVVIHHRNSTDEAKDLVQDIRDKGGKAAHVSGDLSDIRVTQSLVSKAAAAIGEPIDVLINNASVFEKDTAVSMSPENWDLHQAVNLRAPVFLSQQVFRHLPAGRIGCIINIIDQRVLKLNPQYFSYTAAKAGLWTVTRTLAQTMAPNVRVNAISPGPTLANQFQGESDFGRETTSVLLGHGPKLNEITGGIKFLLETPSMTGQMLTLDGGQHLAWRTEDIIED